jgi:hypothetical protein
MRHRVALLPAPSGAAEPKTKSLLSHSSVESPIACSAGIMAVTQIIKGKSLTMRGNTTGDLARAATS